MSDEADTKVQLLKPDEGEPARGGVCQWLRSILGGLRSAMKRPWRQP